MRATIVAYGEILWDLLPSGAVLGGAPFNFLYRVNSLGHRGVMVSRLGADELGERALEIVEGLGLEAGYLQRDGRHPTGTVAVSFDEKRDPDYRIVPQVAYDFIEPEQGLYELIRQADCLCFGTLIQRHSVSRDTLHQLLPSFSGSFVLLDINLRRDCYTRSSVLQSIARADILKLNDGEAAVVAGLYDGSSGRTVDLQRFAELLFSRSDLRYVVVSLGERGAFAASRKGEAVYHPAFSVTLQDPVGSGDAFSAGFLDALLHGRDLAGACRLGNALGALVASQEGGTRPLSRSQIEAFLEHAEPGPVEEALRDFMVF
jgi:fructokinase